MKLLRGRLSQIDSVSNEKEIRKAWGPNWVA